MAENVQLDYKDGLAHSVAMTDAEVLRFYNGIVASLEECHLAPTRDVITARIKLGVVQELLFVKQGCVAYIGYMGTPVIKPRGS